MNNIAPMMKLIWLGSIALLLGACSKQQGSGIRTPEDYVAEQERLADEQAAKDKQQSSDYSDYDTETDLEKKKKWDQKQAELELKRATRSAVTCPESLPEAEQKSVVRGMVKITLMFANDGHVKVATLPADYDDTPVGKCIRRAMEAVIVPAYEGSEHTLEWEVDLAAESE